MTDAGGEYERIAAAPAGQGVISSAAVDHVIGRIPDDGVIRRITRSVYGVHTGQRKVFDVVAKRIVDGAFDRVRPFAILFNHLVAGVINDIGVIAGAACQHIIVRAAVQSVVACFAE